MSPRLLGVVSSRVVWRKASPASRSRWPTCQYARRANRAEPTTAKAIRRTSARPRESVRPIVRSRTSARPNEERSLELGEPGVDRQLAHGRLLAQPIEIGQELL